MNTLLKAIATPLTIFASFAIFGSGLWMYFFSKPHALTEFHEQIGLVFVVAAVLHIVLHWRSFICRLGKVSTYMYIAPVLVFGVMALQEVASSGRKPVSPGQFVKRLDDASLHDLAATFRLSESSVRAQMEADGLVVPQLTSSVREIASKNNRPPRVILSYFVE